MASTQGPAPSHAKTAERLIQEHDLRLAFFKENADVAYLTTSGETQRLEINERIRVLLDQESAEERLLKEAYLTLASHYGKALLCQLVSLVADPDLRELGVSPPTSGVFSSVPNNVTKTQLCESLCQKREFPLDIGIISAAVGLLQVPPRSGLSPRCGGHPC